MRYKCAVIGLGRIGSSFGSDPKRTGQTWTHTDAYKKCAFTELTGAVEIDPKSEERFKKANPDVPVYKTIKDLFGKHKIDMVSICTPTEKHFHIFSELTKHDVKAIFCEKPLSGSVGESEKIVSISRDKGIVSAVNYSRRWQASYNLVADLIKSARIGKVVSINCYYPGQVRNVGSHLFDSLIFLTSSKPLEVSAVATSNDPDPSLNGWIKFDNNIFATFSSTGKTENLIFEIDIIGEKGRITVSDNGSRVESHLFKESPRFTGYRELRPEKIEQPSSNDRFVEALSDMVQVIEGKRKKVKCTPEDGLLVDRLIEKALVSAKKSGVPEILGE